jgi:hypothetical protein
MFSLRSNPSKLMHELTTSESQAFVVKPNSIYILYPEGQSIPLLLSSLASRPTYHFRGM